MSDDNEPNDVIEKVDPPSDISVVKIKTTAKTYDYAYPWRAPTFDKWGGSGFLAEILGQMRLITNAHVASDAEHMQVQFANDSQTYSATLEHVADNCDLAMLSVEDPEFWERAKPIEIAELPEREAFVKVMGFPVGGATMSVTDGIVSRMELDYYAHSGQALTVNQISAPINPGNSGGPVVNKDGKLVGIVHQGYPNRQNLGYMIPANILQHFGKQVEKQEKGFPDLAIEVQPLQNRFLRDYHKMPDKKSGVLISKIAKLSSAFGVLQEGDILMEIDGVPINNDGTAYINPMKKIEFEYLIQNKQLGEEANLKVWRNGVEEELSIKLTSAIGDNESIIPMEHNKRPTYYIISGQLVVQPVTENYMKDKKARFENKDKERPDDQLITINMFIDSGYTDGYTGLNNQLITEINGKKIRNMKDVVWACDSNTASTHIIKTENDKEIVIPNLNATQEKELLDRYDIPKDRSDDLPACQVRAEIEGVEESYLLEESSDEEKEAVDPSKALFFSPGLLDIFKPKDEEEAHEPSEEEEIEISDSASEDELDLSESEGDTDENEKVLERFRSMTFHKSRSLRPH